jgi:hypothetical protein
MSLGTSTDQKVGGSSPPERATARRPEGVQGRGLHHRPPPTRHHDLFEAAAPRKRCWLGSTGTSTDDHANGGAPRIQSQAQSNRTGSSPRIPLASSARNPKKN